MQSITHRLNTFLLVLLVLIAGAIIAILATRASAGPLDPPNPPGSTLPQVEPRAPIPPVGWAGTFPIVINQPGSYFFTRDLTYTGGLAIQISSSNVTLDLNGFTLDGANVGSQGIAVSGQLADLTIENGNVRGWTLEGVTTATNANNLAVQSVFQDLKITNSYHGLDVDSGAMVRRVTVEKDTYGIGIWDLGNRYEGGLIEDCIASENVTTAIQVASNNVTVRGCVIDSNGGQGILIDHAFDVIDGNTIQGTDVGAGVTLSGTASKDTVVRNVFANNAGGAVQDLGVNNRIGPSDTTATGTQPWSNVGP
jgi:hypothetical protein